METRCLLTSGLLALCLWLTASRVVRGDEAGHDSDHQSPCHGAVCPDSQLTNTKTNTNTLKIRTIENDDNNDDEVNTSLLTKSLRRLSILPRRSPSPSHSHSRVRRQTVIVEVEEARSHRLDCTRSEESKAACLKGRCYALDMGQLRQPFCECPAMYEGNRCEQLSTYFYLMYSAELKKAAIIGGVVVGIIIIIVVISVYCSYRKGRKRRKERKPDSRDVAPTKPETAAMIPDGDSHV